LSNIEGRCEQIKALNQLRLVFQVVCNSVRIEDLYNIFINFFNSIQFEIPKNISERNLLHVLCRQHLFSYILLGLMRKKWSFISIALTTSEQWRFTESFQFTSVARITVSWNQIHSTLLQNLFTSTRFWIRPIFWDFLSFVIYSGSMYM